VREYDNVGQLKWVSPKIFSHALKELCWNVPGVAQRGSEARRINP
jgi:hypothetical protein